MIEVYQSELNESIPLEYIGRVKYIGESFGVTGLTEGKIYFIVRDAQGDLKVVDDSEEDYIYSLTNPAPCTGYSKGGIFKCIDSLLGILKNIWKNTKRKATHDIASRWLVLSYLKI